MMWSCQKQNYEWLCVLSRDGNEIVWMGGSSPFNLGRSVINTFPQFYRCLFMKTMLIRIPNFGISDSMKCSIRILQTSPTRRVSNFIGVLHHWNHWNYDESSSRANWSSPTRHVSNFIESLMQCQLERETNRRRANNLLSSKLLPIVQDT